LVRVEKTQKVGDENVGCAGRGRNATVTIGREAGEEEVGADNEIKSATMLALAAA